MQENNIQDIATATALTTAQDFLETIPSDVFQTLSPRFLQGLENDLQAELYSLIHSRLLWFEQTVQLEIAEQQRLKEYEVVRPEPIQPEATPKPLVSASRLQISPAKAKRQLQQAPIPLPVTAVAVENTPTEPKPKHTASYQNDQLPGLGEPDSITPLRGHLDAAETSPPEDILKQYNFKPEDFSPRNSEVRPRRRRRSAAALA